MSSEWKTYADSDTKCLINKTIRQTRESTTRWVQRRQLSQ